MKPTPFLINLKMGKPVELATLHQCLTYEGLMAGSPTRETNENIVQRALLTVRDKWNFPVLLVPPVQTEGASNSSWLPGVECFATLDGRFSVTGHGDASTLTVVWFQNSFAMPIEESVLEQIRGIDWNSHARDYCY